MTLSDEDIAMCRRVLGALCDDPDRLAALAPEVRRELLERAGRLSRPTELERRRLAKALRRRDRRLAKQADARVLDATGIRAARRHVRFLTPPAAAGALPPPEPERELGEARKCYVCKAEYVIVHHHYDSMCPPCAEHNFTKRHQSADLAGRVALVTGGRVKIGYQAAIKLLRAGARVVVTTRFPSDAARRFAAEADHDMWRERLSIHGIDLRYTPEVEHLAARLVGTLDRLDFLIHNACQTVRRPAAFFAHMQAGEELALSGESHLFPAGCFDADEQQIDLRPQNSWRLALADVPTVELLEVHLVNAVAPFVLTARLKPLLLADRSRPRHVVNVSAMEGQFYRAWKTDRHPHTNMAKAALNMLTRTSSPDYARDGIFMNSVDTGWVTDEDPEVLAARKTEVHGFHPPLDIVDGAARILDPVFADLREHGRFYKDYQPTDW